jgi:hypothetical protein
MGGKAIADQEPVSVASTSLGLRLKYMLDPIQIDGAVRVSLFRAGKVPSRGGMGGPVTTMCGGRPDNQGIERPTVSRDASRSGDQGPLDSRTPLFAQLVSAYQDFKASQYTQQHASLIHIIHVLGKTAGWRCSGAMTWNHSFTLSWIL